MKQEMININANLVAEPTFSNFEKDGETVEVTNFTLVKKEIAVKGVVHQLCSLWRKDRNSKSL